MKKLPSPQEGFTWVKIDDFTKKYLNLIPLDMFVELENRFVKGVDYIQITTSTIEHLEFKLAEKKRKKTTIKK